MNREEYKALIETVLRHDHLYYGECRPEISDYDYDMLVKRVEEVEKKHPDWIEPYSPTQRVSERPSSGFSQVAHKEAMLSLSNTYSEEEIEQFIARIHKLLERSDVLFSLELKMDGTAISLHYEKGILVRAVTRGDGKRGDDVTENVKTIRSLPLKLQVAPDELEVRGEVYMPLKVFTALNEKADVPWANPRNAAAGSLKLLDSSIAAGRGLEIMCYGALGSEAEAQSGVHAYLKEAGLPVAGEEMLCTASSASEIIAFIRKVESIRSTLPFEIDGVVIKVDSLRDQKRIGATNKSPRWATAYKFAPESAQASIKAITVQVGRTGVLTPVAELEPTQLAGSCISRATLHNREEVERKDIRVGDTVTIEKGGDVIPKVVSVDSKARKEGSKKWHMPSECPVCGMRVVSKEGEVAVRCPNKLGCFGQNLQRLIFFASKPALDIDNLGVKVIEKLVQKGVIHSLGDIFRITREDLEGIEGFKEKSIDNLLRSIEKAKKTTLPRLLLGLGIPFVGKETAELIAYAAGDVAHVTKLSVDDLIAIDGIGEKVAHSFTSYFQDEAHVRELDKILSSGVVCEKMEPKAHLDHPFSGKSFVLTGTLGGYTRAEAGGLIKERGGKVSSAVSSKTDFLLAGESAGSKYAKAEKLGVTILSEKEFEKLL